MTNIVGVIMDEMMRMSEIISTDEQVRTEKIHMDTFVVERILLDEMIMKEFIHNFMDDCTDDAFISRGVSPS